MATSSRKEMDTRSERSLSRKKAKVEPQGLIPTDLILDILPCLPVKDVLRFRSVCKEWNFHLRTPEFASIHYNYWSQMRHKTLSCSSSFIFLRTLDHDPSKLRDPCHESNIVLTFVTLKKTITTLEVTVDKEIDVRSIISSVSFPPNFECPTKLDIRSLQLVCPFDGLICLGYDEHVIMYNPATRKSQLLPFEGQFSEFELSYIRRNAEGKLIVWFEPIEKIYKVFRIFNWKASFKIKIYDSTDNSWRTSEEIAGVAYPLTSLLLNGVLHFYIENSSGPLIITFDARLEMFGKFELPCSRFRNPYSIFLNFNGNLAFSKLKFNMNDFVYDIWVMTEYGVQQSWTKKYSIIHGIRHVYQPLSFWKNMDEEDELLVRLWNRKIASVNLVTQEMTDFYVDFSDFRFCSPCDPWRMTKMAPYNISCLLS